MVRSQYKLVACLLALSLSGCDKLPISAFENKSTEQSSRGETGSAEQTEVPGATSIAKDLSSGAYDKAVEGAQAAIAVDSHNPELLLLLARAQAKLQNVGEAVKALNASFEAGFHDPRGALNNPDFDGIRTNPIFAAFANGYQRKQVRRATTPLSEQMSSITAGDVSIHESRDGRARIRAGDVVIED